MQARVRTGGARNRRNRANSANMRDRPVSGYCVLRHARSRPRDCARYLWNVRSAPVRKADETAHRVRSAKPIQYSPPLARGILRTSSALSSCAWNGG